MARTKGDGSLVRVQMLVGLEINLEAGGKATYNRGAFYLLDKQVATDWIMNGLAVDEVGEIILPEIPAAEGEGGE